MWVFVCSCVIAVFLYRCCIIIGRVLKWHFHDGKNEKYCQLLFAAKMGASGHNNTHTHSHKNTETYKLTHFLRKYEVFGLLTSNVLIIRFHFFSVIKSSFTFSRSLIHLLLFVDTHKIGIEKIYAPIFFRLHLFILLPSEKH